MSPKGLKLSLLFFVIQKLPRQEGVGEWSFSVISLIKHKDIKNKLSTNKKEKSTGEKMNFYQNCF